MELTQFVNDSALVVKVLVTFLTKPHSSEQLKDVQFILVRWDDGE